MITLEEFKEVLCKWQESENKRYKCQKAFCYFDGSDRPTESEIKEFYEALIENQYFIEYKEIANVEELEEFTKYLFFKRASFSVNEYVELNYDYKCAVYCTGNGIWIFPGSYLKRKPFPFEAYLIDESIKKAEIFDRKLVEEEKLRLKELKRPLTTNKKRAKV